MSVLVSVADFRQWAGTNIPASVPDDLILDCLDEAEAGILAETGATIAAIQVNTLAVAEMVGEQKRRANRLLARRNSPEGIAGAGSEGSTLSRVSPTPPSYQMPSGNRSCLGAAAGRDVARAQALMAEAGVGNGAESAEVKIPPVVFGFEMLLGHALG